MDDLDTLAKLRQLVVKFREDRAWGPFHTPKNLAIALAVETGELQELFLWKDEAEIAEFLESEGFRQRIQEEAADILIYLLYLAEAVGFDLSEALRAKLKKNQARYPIDKSFGIHKKYTELE